MNSSKLYTILLTATLLLTACNDKTTPSLTTTASSASSTTTVATDAWLGKWNGPEGTFMEISGGKGNYKITIQDLDGAKEYQGTSTGNQITFERDGTNETIKSSKGADTGMKWLADKSNCLRVRLGEGWCKD